MTATVGPVEFEGVYNVVDRGGWQSPEQKVDRDFDWQSYKQRDPVEVSFSAKLKKDKLESLRGVREEDKPIGVSVGLISLEKAAISDLEVTQQARMRSHVEVSVTVKEIFTADVETTEIVIETPSGTQSGDGGGGGGGGDDSGSDSTLVDSSGDDTGGSGPVEDLSRSQQRQAMREATAGPYI
jgi:hypothetical protein